MSKEIDKIRNKSKQELLNLIKSKTSKRAVLAELNIARNNKHALEFLTTFIQDNKIDITHHTSGTPYRNRYEKEFVENAISDSSNWKELLEKFNLSDKGQNLRTIKRVIAFYELQFISTKFNRKPYREFTFEEIFCEGSTVSHGVPKAYILRNGLLDEVCSECTVGTFWNGRFLTLQLDHINGIKNDNRLSNLRLLCPNCHSQTPTYGSKKRLT